MIVIDLEQQKSTLPYITSKEIYLNGNVEKFHPEGLYSEVIFGPKHPWKCSCGAIEGSSYDGEICDNCGVTCSDGSKRSKQFAKIKLPRKVLWPMFKKHLQALFGIKAIKDIFNPVKYQQNMEDPYYYDINTASLKKKKQIKNFEEFIFKTMPIYDIASLNAFYDFMKEDISLKQILHYTINPSYVDYVFTNEIIVTPPSSRPIITANNKKDIPEISKFYKNLLSMTINNYWENPSRKDEEFNKNIYAFQKIFDDMETFIFDKIFLEKTSVMRDAFSGSTVEFSARSVIVPAPELPPYGVALPRDTTLKITITEFLHFLIKELENIKNEDNCIEEEMDIQQMIQMVRVGNPNFPIDDYLFKRFLISKYMNKKIMIERAPVLWRYNFSGVLISSVLFENDGYQLFKDLNNDPEYNGPRLSNTTMYNNKVMGINTIISPAFNFDFDGDSMLTLSLQSEQAKKEWVNTFLGNGSNIEFEHNNSLIPSLEHEAIYSMWALTFKCSDFDINTNQVWNEDPIYLKDFKYNFKIINEKYNYKVRLYKNEESDEIIEIPYGIAAINRSLQFNLFETNPGEMAKKQIKESIKKLLEIVGHEKFYHHFHNLDKFLLWCSTSVVFCGPTFNLKDFAVGSSKITEYKNTLVNEPYLGFHQNEILFSDYVKEEISKDSENSLYKVFRSDARIKSVQLLKAASNSGIPTDIHGKAFINNIKEDLLYGHSKEGFFQSGDSARLALAQRQEAIPKGGELQRRFYYILGFLKLSRTDDCGSKKVFPIEIINKDHLESLNGRYYINESGIKKHLIFKEINPSDFIGKTLNFRYPGGCEQPGYKICNCCFGSRQPQSSNLGAAVGSYISESIIQSVLRTHHFSGAFITNIRKPILEIIKRNRFQSPNLIFIKKENQTIERNDIESLRGFYEEVYPNKDDIELIRNINLDTDTEFGWEIKVHSAPFNDDSVKKLNNIIQIIDRDRKNDDLMTEQEMYKKLLQEIILPNGILSIYVELIMSILFFDENGVMCRYGSEPNHQIALKNIIGTCDPKLTIFYNFNSTAVAKILKDSNKILGAEHMYSNILKLFDK